MKKALSALLAVSLLAGCSSAGSSAASSAKSTASLTPGTYSATAKGMDGDISINVTVDNSKITKIDVTDDNETAGVGDKALQLVSDAIVKNQSLGVDNVSGATVSSNAMKMAVEDALKQAGGDPSEWENREVKKESKDESFDYDVVVVGSGYAGLQSALKASTDGAKVAVIEKLGIVGGTSIFSSGAYIAAFTQDEIPDKVKVWVDRNTQNENKINMDKLNTAMSVSPEIISTYTDLGIQGKTFMETGWGIDASEKATKNASTIKLADAEVHPKGGEFLISTLYNKLVDNGVDVYLNTPATKLLTKDGSVTGVECDTDEGTKTFNAKAVVLATGTYARNKDILKELDPEAVDNFTAASKGDEGDGLKMAEDVGATTYDYQHKMSGIFAPDPYDMPVVGQPYNSYPYDCVLVNSKAERPVKEDAGTHFQMEYFIEQDGPDYGWVVMDQGVADRFLNLDEYLQDTADGSSYIEAYKESSLADLAKDMNVDADKLQATIDRYNELCAAGEDTDLGKDAKYLHAIDDGTYYAVKEYDMTRGEYGGIVTDDKAEVTDKDGKAIPGLYAAGLISSGDLIGDFYPGMEALGICSFMGWISGREAASFAQK